MEDDLIVDANMQAQKVFDALAEQECVATLYARTDDCSADIHLRYGECGEEVKPKPKYLSLILVSDRESRIVRHIVWRLLDLVFWLGNVKGLAEWREKPE